MNTVAWVFGSIAVVSFAVWLYLHLAEEKDQ